MEVLLTGPAETTLTAQCDSELASVINIAKLRQAQSNNSVLSMCPALPEIRHCNREKHKSTCLGSKNAVGKNQPHLQKGELLC